MVYLIVMLVLHGICTYIWFSSRCCIVHSILYLLAMLLLYGISGCYVGAVWYAW